MLKMRSPIVPSPLMTQFQGNFSSVEIKTCCVKNAEMDATNCTHANMVPYSSRLNHSLPVQPAPMNPKDAPMATKICDINKEIKEVDIAKQKMPKVRIVQAMGKIVRIPMRSKIEPEIIWVAAKNRV